MSAPALAFDVSPLGRSQSGRAHSANREQGLFPMSSRTAFVRPRSPRRGHLFDAAA